MKAAQQEQSKKGSRNLADNDERPPPRRGRPLSGLRGRLLFLIALTLLPAFGIVLYTGHSERRAAEHDAERHALTVTLEAAADQARLIDEARSVLSVLAEMPAMAHPGHSCPSFLRHYLIKQPRLANIGAIDTSGHIVCSAASNAVGRPDVSDRQYYRRALAGHRFALGGYQVGRITGEPVLVAAYPVLDAHGTVRRILFAAMQLNWMNALAARTNLPAGSVFALLDSRGHVLAHYADGHQPPGSRALLASTLHQPPPRSPWAGRVTLHGRDWLVTYARLGNSPALDGLHATVAIPTSVAFASANHAMYRNLALLTDLGLATLALAWFGGDMLILRPIRRLVGATRRIAGGDLQTRTGIVSGPDEIVTLGRALDDMATSLQQRHRDHQAQNERIARLNRIYQVLSAINGAIIRVRDRDQLLQEACRIAVELGHFRFAWVGLIEPGSNNLTAAAHAGEAREFIQGVRVTLNPEEPEGRGLMGTAIRSGLHAVSNASQHDRRLLAWWHDFVRLGVQSAAAFPLRNQRGVVGALALYTDEPDFFDERELALLDELAADTSLGLEHIEKDRQLNYLAYWDPLTNLPNRSLFEDRLGQSLRRAERAGTQVMVLLIDIAHFSRINDTKGRAAGDRVLQAVAGRLGTVVRDSDSLGDLGSQAARLGSHEFGLVIDQTGDPAVAESVAERISSRLVEPVTVEDDQVAITALMGASVYPRDGTQPDELLHKAQFAVHSRREQQGSRLAFYSPEKDTAAKARYALENDLRRAVENEDFYLEYQPRVDARTGNLVGAEALLRWHRPGHGRVPPDRFVPVLEETGLIDQVGEWVARTAFAQRIAWNGVVSDNFVMSVNASSHELRSPDYASRICRLVQTIGVRPGWLEIEITETGLVETGNTTLEMLSALKNLGLRLSVDDFGTGYSALSYLRQFPVDVLKIDQSFVRDITRHDEAMSIVRSIIALARGLKLAVVAEGVETEEQSHLLTAEGCHEMQGYLFSRPISAAELEALVGKQPLFQL